MITREGVDALEGTPSVLAQLIQHSNNTGRSLERLAFLIAGSETWQVSDFVAARRACGPGVRIFNSYGVTEATIDSVLFEVDEEKIGSNSQVPIGWPIANTEVFVLDAHRNPVPVGVPGELYVGGAGLARSYLNQPEITTERFVAHPFSNRSGARLYKTGDLVRYRPDGNLEFLGRLDEQVKVRGVRIEPGEVEAALVQHPKVRQGVVVAREDEPDDKRLVAYIVPAADTTPPPSELRAFLREKLPDYMVPTAFVVLDELPLTPNGKVDRRALPVPEGLRTQLENKFVAPCGTLEERLAGIWSEVLGVDWVGAHSDFFELGGHSLLAVSLFARIEKTFGQRLPLATVFQAPTVGQLADVLRRKGEGAPWSSLVAIQPHGSRPPFFCVHGWGDQVLIFHALAQHLGPDQPFYGLQAPDQDAEGIVSSKIKEMAASYVRELREVQPEGPYFLGGHSVGGVVALEMAQQLHTQGQDVALLAMFDTTRPNYLKASNRRQRTKQALSSYEAQSYPGRITLFRVARPKFDTAYPDEPYLGWDSVATGGVEMHKVRGRHRSMLREPYVRGLAEQLKTCLEQARTNSS